MKKRLFGSAVLPVLLVTLVGASAQAEENAACVEMAATHFGPDRESGTRGGRFVLDVACEGSSGNLACVGHDETAVRTVGVWGGGSEFFDGLTLYQYGSDTQAEAARRAREPWSIKLASGHREASTASTLLTLGARTTTFITDQELTLTVPRDFSGAHLKIRNPGGFLRLASTSVNETLRCQKVPQNWRPANWPKLLKEYTRADGVKFRSGDLVLAPVKALTRGTRERLPEPGTLLPGRIDWIYDNGRDGARFSISGSNRAQATVIGAKDYELLEKLEDIGAYDVESETARFRWTLPGEIKPLLRGPLDQLFRTGTLPANETLDISKEVDCYRIGAPEVSNFHFDIQVQFEQGGGNLRETRQRLGMLERNAASRALVSAWTASRDPSAPADARSLFREVRVPTYPGRVWVLARERKGAPAPEAYWACFGEAPRR